MTKLDSKRFKIEPGFGSACVLSAKTEQEATEWFEAIENITKRLSVPISSTDTDVVQSEVEEQQWSQVVKIRKQEKRVSRYMSQIETLENKLQLEIAARQALEQHVRSLMQRIEVLEQRLGVAPPSIASPPASVQPQQPPSEPIKEAPPE